jgi:hypothetical protein
MAMEPWFFEIPLPALADERDRRQLKSLNAAGRHLMLLMFQQVAMDANIPLDGITPDYAEIGIDEVQSAVIAAARQPGKQPETDLEELALSYVGLLRDWTNLFNASQGWTSDLQ